MKGIVFLLSLIIVAAIASRPSVTAERKELVRHVVVFKFKQGANEEQIRQVTNGFRDLKNKIPGIVSIEYGVNNSSEGKNHGFTHPFLLTFEDVKARDAYLPHPEHKRFVELLGKLGILEDVFVIDYTPKT